MEPSTAELLRPILRDDASVLDDDLAPYEFALAVIAIQTQALRNLLPADQATRIRSQVIECLEPDGQAAIAEYQQSWDESLDAHVPPHGGIASVLFDKLGCSESIAVGDVRMKSPIVLSSLGGALIDYVTTMPVWKTIVSKCELVRDED